VSKQQAIMPGQCYELEDGSSSFKDFHGSRNNRFTSPEQAAKNRIQHPSNVLHFFNAQPESSTEIFGQVRTQRTRLCRRKLRFLTRRLICN
jgi:heterogeneous nuclear ribonucleoprotein L